jgi:hypothetical protein
MNSSPPLAKAWATVGRDLYSASSAEEKEVADCVLNSLFEGDAEGKDHFMERFFLETNVLLGNVNSKSTRENAR